MRKGRTVNLHPAVAAALLFAPASALPAGGEGAPRPNLVFFFTDDQPQSAMGCMGNPHLKTPNMDRLAAEGVLFENSFVTTAICCSSRASLFSGQHMVRHGIDSFVKALSAEQWAGTYPVLLRAAGYRTAFLGKLAIGNPKTEPPGLCLPADRFDLWYGFPQSIAFNQDGRYLTTVMEEKAVRFIREQPKDKPFLLIMALKEPHGPRDFEDPDLPRDLVQGPFPRPATLSDEAFVRLPAAIRASRNSVGPPFATDDATFQQEMAQTYRYVCRADLAVGRVMQAVRDAGLDGNTVVFFSSDNGSLDGAHRLHGKWSMYEESIRVPLIVRDPRLPAAARGRRAQMALNIDIAPTMLAMAGVPVPAAMQGMDLRPILADPKTPGRADWYYEHDIQLVGGGKPLPRCEGVRSDRWKYTRYKDTEPAQEELFDLQADPREERNLAGDPAGAKTLASLRARCVELRAALK
ncbi:MAG: DUF4976 domain-containing protein [Lentisphaerae bacterium]|nr:DUF4976 domain-containing protein [Lentisphaerota bacterium]